MPGPAAAILLATRALHQAAVAAKTLDAIAAEAALLDSARADAAREFSTENIDFFIAVSIYDGTASAAVNARKPAGLPSGKPAQFAWIYNQFIRSDAPQQVNLAGANKTPLDAHGSGLAALAPGDLANAVRAAKEEISSLVQSDSLPRWRRTLEAAVKAAQVAADKEAAAEAAAAAATKKTKQIALLAELRNHQKAKLMSVRFTIGGDHPAGKFILYATCVDDRPVLLVSSTIMEGINPKHTQSAAAVDGTDAVAGIWVKQAGPTGVSFTVEGADATAKRFLGALKAIGVPVASVKAGTRAAVLNCIDVVAPKQVKAEAEARSAAIDKALKAEAKEPVKLTLTILGTKPKGHPTPAEAFKDAERGLRVVGPELLRIAKLEFAPAKLQVGLAKLPDDGNYWIVLHADGAKFNQDVEAFAGLYLFRGDARPQGKNPTGKTLADGWFPVVTKQEAKNRLIEDSLKAAGLI